ncbi:sigma 54-interacting transcriptional regulator [Irregularibacter muris]|uniref:Sigma 54-interacting transcriptional regulator n=1 Tax=Irregularibacter muris TaxID=1796619 RepID=A0AAE3L3V0_9FIRM|nr:sigma 54-interacting transcriptional regulator [Irregularibacter muris]MCR1898893.1 sigma 54-interacting transcriptional regulator [Irregularibacter muris]
MREKKKMAMVTVDFHANIVLSQQLREAFGDQVEVVPVLLHDCDVIDTEGMDLIVCSSELIEKSVRAKINQEVPLVSVKRTINVMNVLELFSLDREEKVLLVSNLPSIAQETIKLLKELGIEHVEFVPHYPGYNGPVYDIAVTAGGKHLVPQGVKRIIDIGLRVIDTSSIIEIFLKLDLPTKELHILSEKYSKEMIHLNAYHNEMNNMLKAMFQVSNDGIAALDTEGSIFFYNHKFAELIGYKGRRLIFRNIMDLIEDESIIDILLDVQDRNHEIVNIHRKEIILNKRLLYQGNKLRGHVIGIQELLYIQNLEKEVRKKLVDKGFIAKYDFKDLVGNSEELQNKIALAKKIASKDLTVLIQGEDGTGKEIFANGIHNCSKRKNETFVAVNMAALSENLVESELFGYEGGSFTGAAKRGKAGFFEQAHGGTIFIDEIGDASSKIQMSLLRVLQEKSIIRVGGSKIIPIDVRVIAATNQDLYDLVLKGKFRKDLYYRLKVLHFKVPTLRERIEDIPSLAQYFFEKLNSNKYLSDEVIQAFNHYSWPGNIRELENLIYYLDSIVEKQRVTLRDLPEELIAQLTPFNELPQWEGEHASKNLFFVEKMDVYIEILKILERANRLDLKIGRNKITEILKTKGLNFSTEQIRTKLNKLEELGLVDIGKTKQGTRINEKGKIFLKENECKN